MNNEMSELITAKELGQMLIEYGDVPVKLRDGFLFSTILKKDAVSICLHSASGTAYGDIPAVARLDIVVHDNA